MGIPGGQATSSTNSMEILVRDFDPDTDREAVDRTCKVGPSSPLSLYTDLLAEQVCRIRLSSFQNAAQVAEAVKGEEKEIVGLIRGCIKTITCEKKNRRLDKNRTMPIFTKVAYVPGLRVAPPHRRVSIWRRRVLKIQSWFEENGAEYAYLATDKDNTASIHLFNVRCGYSKFRCPSILVQPVFGHRLPIPHHVPVVKLSPFEAETIYRRKFSTTEFFPCDIDTVQKNRLSLGTFQAVRSDYHWSRSNYHWSCLDDFLTELPESWVVVSVWDSKAVFRLKVRGAGRIRKGFAWTTRLMDRVLPWFRLPSVPDIFRQFGFISCMDVRVGAEHGGIGSNSASIRIFSRGLTGAGWRRRS